MNRRAVGWFYATLIGATVIGLVFVGVFWFSEDSVKSPVHPVPSPGETSRVPPAADQKFASRTDANTTDSGSLLLNIGYRCPSVQGELTDDCLLALNERFGDETTQAGPMVPVCDQPTWNQVFDDPSANRSLVSQALSRQECRFNSYEVRSNTDCARDAFAELSALFLHCTDRNEYRDGPRFTEAVLSEILDGVFSADSIDYQQKRQRIEEDYYRERWVAERCRLIDRSAFAPIKELKGVYTGVFGYLSKTYGVGVAVEPEEPAEGPIWQNDVRRRVRDHGFTLRATAARMGHFWALSEYLDHSHSLDDIFALNPAQALILRGRLEADSAEIPPVSAEAYIEEQRRWTDMWKRLEETSPRIMNHFDFINFAHTVFPASYSQALDRWWMSQEPAVIDVYEEFKRGSVVETHEEIELNRQSVRKPYVHAALLHMLRRNIQYSVEAIPKWAVDISDEELEKAHEILAWMDEKYPHAVHAPDPSAAETCDLRLQTPESESAVDELEFERVSE